MGYAFSSFWTQFFPPKPGFTEKDVADLGGKVYIVTGATSGIGKELARLLFSRNAKVYAAARNKTKAEQAVAEIEKACPNSKGKLVFLALDLEDLSAIKRSAGEFLAKETRLDVLFNNAGINSPTPTPSYSPQGHEQNMAVNCLGPQLFTKLLTPILQSTAVASSSNSKDSVRVVWLSSYGKEMFAVPKIGVALENLDYHDLDPKKAGPDERYCASKVGAWAQAVEYGKRVPEVVSVPLNPGNLKSELFKDRDMKIRILAKLAGYPVVNGAYTQLYAGLSREVTREALGRENWVIPFGRIWPIRPDLKEAVKTKAEGGTGGTEAFWEWCEERVKEYV
ncbi:putative short-chain dehydrogenase [Podospora australis]|uniref:Short-chain dehydrogenase n=1 Tax=Podospora australis TaxID=1536484 RepID=A0AAN7AN49_9PEZI|nr:putative short-chain dehydrogenase [Podospora australis]